MHELSKMDIEQVKGSGLPGFFIGWAVGHAMSKAVDSYAGWVRGGAGGWTVEYDPNGYDDPLL